jgi:hypothetical protein
MIDDVDYMRKHGEIETHVFYIDSDQRSDLGDKENDFTVEFDEPVRNVVGVDVIDSNIPSTTYTIDSYNDVFRMFAIGFDRGSTAYDIGQAHRYTEIFLNLMRGDEVWTDETTDAETVVVFRDYRAAALPDLSGMPSLSDAPYGFVPAVTILGPDDAPPPGTEAIIVSDGPGARLRVAYHADDGTGVPQKVFKRVFFFPNGNYTHPAKIVTMAEQGDGPRSALVANADQPFLVASGVPIERLGTLDILAQPWSVALGTEQEFDSDGTCVIVFDTTSSMANVIGFHVAVDAIEVYGRQMSTNVAPGAPYPGAKIRTALLMNMSGDRYISLRCPQIESSAYIGTGRRSQRGIGLFKLSNPGIIRRETADYVNVIKKRFHPIAKLDRLRFRFERGATGELYNFRGVGTLMIVAIDVYVNKKPPPFEASSLNPEYNIDFRRYMIDTMHDDALYEREQQDALPLDDRRVTSGLAEHNTLANLYGRDVAHQR